MTYTISPDRQKLTLTATAAEREALNRWEDEHPTLGIGSSDAESDFLEALVCNSELQWIDPSETGDLTGAPMLGILSDEQPNHVPYWAVANYGSRPVSNATKSFILERWAFMDYQTRSILEDLRDKGEAVFIGGNKTR